MIRNRIESILDAGAVFEIENRQGKVVHLAGGVEWIGDDRLIIGRPYLETDFAFNDFDFHVVRLNGQALDDGEVVTIPIKDDSGRSAILRVAPIELSDSYGGPELERVKADLIRFRDLLRSDNRPEWVEVLKYVKKNRL